MEPGREDGHLAQNPGPQDLDLLQTLQADLDQAGVPRELHAGLVAALAATFPFGEDLGHPCMGGAA
ncbi:MAG TPA: hypothetical protein VFF76_04545 [Holophagaceae bacterium]|jgi:hypothetical protein|nr:hypothetical protein [Holophagaceae bacterium]